MHSEPARNDARTLAHSITAILCAAGSVQSLSAYAQEAAEEKGDVTELSDLSVTEDPFRSLSNEPSASSFGFSKPLLETPRAISFISEEQIRVLGISTVEDLTRAVPGTFTTTRYGLQGGVQVRGVPSDYYYRGMKRLNQQGHARTVLSAMDNIEVVKGPPSPLFGMGKIGGYVNLDPKSSRARTGKYLTGTKGFVQGVAGSYDRKEVSFGAGGPFSAGGRQGGYYLYGLAEDSDTYVKQVGVKQRFLQGTASIDNIAGPFRLEFGGQAQQSITSGAYMNRGTQDLYDSGRYITGMPLANLDLNGDGAVGFLERNQGSPASGNLSVSNQALVQRYSWPTDASGNFLDIKDWPTVAGIPQTMLDYLNSASAPTCSAAQYMAGLSAGGPVPTSGQLPVGLFLDPCTTGYTDVDWRRNGAYEREQNAKQALMYVDLIYDTNPDFTVKNQLFYDLLDSFKDSYLPYGEKQDIHVFEEKFTVTRRVPSEWLPSWLRINSLGSINYRRTKGSIRSSGADYDLRQDVMFGNGHLTPNTSFWTQLNNRDLATGALATTIRHSKFDERGVGLLFDVDIGAKTNLLVGGRYDESRAEASDTPEFLETIGTAANPGRLCPCSNTLITDGKDDGTSWSVSLSHQLPWGLRPYFTRAKTSITLDGSNNVIAPNVITSPSGHIGEAELKELGVKSSFFNNKLQITVAGYEQTRTDVSAPTDPSLGADVSSSEYRGVEAEVKWQPTRELFISAYLLRQHGKYTVAQDNLIVDIDARTAGFQDVVDASGNVIYPAEAFFYGGRVNVALPAALVKGRYMDRFGNPNTQAGMSAIYNFGNGWGVLLNPTYQGEAWADRLKRYRMPDALVWNAGVTYDTGRYHFKLNGYNVTDERYFRAASFESVSGLMFSVMPGARVELTAKVDF